MRGELPWIEKDREALAWAAGGLLVAFGARAVSLVTGSVLVRLVMASYILWTLKLHAWLIVMGVAYRRGDVGQLQWLASRTALGQALPFMEYFSNIVPLDAVSVLGTTLGVLAAGALIVNRLCVAFRTLLSGFLLFAAYWHVGYALRAPGFEVLDFGPAWPFTWAASNAWLMLILILLWAAGRQQRVRGLAQMVARAAPHPPATPLMSDPLSVRSSQRPVDAPHRVGGDMSSMADATSLERLTRCFDRHPIAGSVAVLVALNIVFWVLYPLTMVVLSVPQALAHGGFGSRPDPLVSTAAWALWAAVVSVAAWRILAVSGWERFVGLSSGGRQPWLAWMPALLILVNLNGLPGSTLHTPDWKPALQAGVTAVSTGAFEELVFRGLILAILLARFHRTRRQVLGAVLLSSVLFGLWHVGPLATPQVPWQHAVANILYAVLAGVGFAAVVLRTRSLWLVAAIHAGIDLANFLPVLLTRGDVAPAVVLTRPDQATLSAILTTLLCVPLFLYGLWLLRDMGRLDLAFPARGRGDDSRARESAPVGGA
jgi:membrane protease YdiL (CAAX protease family)